MGIRRLSIGIFGALAACVLAAPAHAARPDELVALSAVFGELHHVRRMCEPKREGDLWRERMKQLVRLEQPTAKLRRRLVASFNDGFRSAQERYSECDRAAERFAEGRAGLGAEIAAKLAN
ncbi:MAG: TIGR02301 family protein [Pseudomonadota bacterium]